MRRHLVIALAVTLAPPPALAVYQEVTCERNIATGAIELDENGQFYVKSWGMTYRVITERDRVGAYDNSGEPIPVPARRPGWVTGLCMIEAHTPKILEQPPTHLPPRSP
jgi:hypothetical protein